MAPYVISQISLSLGPARHRQAGACGCIMGSFGIFCCVRVLTSSRLSNMLPCAVHDPGEEYTNEQQTLHTTTASARHIHGFFMHATPEPHTPHHRTWSYPLSNCRRGSDAEAVRIENLISTSTCKGSCTASATSFFDGVHHFHGGARW